MQDSSKSRQCFVHGLMFETDWTAYRSNMLALIQASMCLTKKAKQVLLYALSMTLSCVYSSAGRAGGC